MNKAISEEKFEEAIETHLLADGWLKINNTDYDAALGLVPGEMVAFLKTSQPDEWDALVSRIGAGDETEAIKKVVAYVARQIDHRGTIRVLKNPTRMDGVTFHLAFFEPVNTSNPKLWERYEANRLGVARQIHYSATDKRLSLDMVLFINGLPTATVELKNPMTGQTVEKAKLQYQDNRKPSEPLFQDRAVAHFAVDPDQVHMTTRLDGKQTIFTPFNQGSAGAGKPGGAGNPLNPAPRGYKTDYLWKQVWAPAAWLKMFGSFVYTENVRNGRGEKVRRRRTVFPRFHQWDAVQKAVADTARTGPGTNRLLQHSAGSGKSNTIAWLALNLAALGDTAPGAGGAMFDKVIVVTDRRALNSQLQNVMSAADNTRGVMKHIDGKMDSQDLREALAGNGSARIITTTLQKFPHVAAHLKQKGGDVSGEKFAIIFDEAHSSASGEMMDALIAVLSGKHQTGEEMEAVARLRGKQNNLSIYAFTATPKPETLTLFGSKPSPFKASSQLSFNFPDDNASNGLEPFHTYSMRQAIEENCILDVCKDYTEIPTLTRIGAVCEGDPEIPKWGVMPHLERHVSEDAKVVHLVAQHIVDDFSAYSAHCIGGKAKAMAVAQSRLHAVRLTHAIRHYAASLPLFAGDPNAGTLVAFSETVTDPDSGEEFTEGQMNGFGEEELPAKFTNGQSRILVVAGKYQTGFDQPLLHTMYVVKDLKGVNAVQTLSRLNRTHPGKVGVRVVDFAGNRGNLEEAFAKHREGGFAFGKDRGLLARKYGELVAAGMFTPKEAEKFLSAANTDNIHDHAEAQNVMDHVLRRIGDSDDGGRKFLAQLAYYVNHYRLMAANVENAEQAWEIVYRFGRALRSGPLSGRSNVPPVEQLVKVVDVSLSGASFGGELSIETCTPNPAPAPPGAGSVPEMWFLSEMVALWNENALSGGTGEDAKIVGQMVTDLVENAEIAELASSNNPESFADGVWLRCKHEIYRAGFSTEAVEKVVSDTDFARNVSNFVAHAAWRLIHQQIPGRVCV